jgi:hypothetical protein
MAERTNPSLLAAFAIPPVEEAREKDTLAKRERNSWIARYLYRPKV